MSIGPEVPPCCSIVIPVYNSAGVIGATVNRTAEVCLRARLTFEIILINDASVDASAGVIDALARSQPYVRVTHLPANRGQHAAIHIGLGQARGDYVITIDDDLQNPPDEILRLIECAREGHDLVFGRFRIKHHGWFRRLGSRVVNHLNRILYGKPTDLVVSNFRLMTRPVVQRLLAFQTDRPYITGLALLAARAPANVFVEHQPRTIGESGYTLPKLLALLVRVIVGRPRNLGPTDRHTGDAAAIDLCEPRGP